MSKKVKSSFLGAFLLASCTYIDSSLNGFELCGIDRGLTSLAHSVRDNEPTRYQEPISKSSNQGLVNLTLNPQSHYGFDNSNSNDFRNSTKIGPLELSSTQYQEFLRLKLPFFPALEFPLDKENNFEEKGSDFRYFDSYTSDESNYQEDVPISALGRIAKKLLWDTEIARPARVVSEEISGLSNWPTKTIFGEKARSDLELKLSTGKLETIYNVSFEDPRYVLEIIYKRAITSREEDAVNLSFKVRF